MTGDYDGEARARDIAAGLATRARAAESEEGSNPDGSRGTDDTSGAFYHKLVALNDKIGVFQEQFYGRKPKQQVNYDRLLKDKKMNFETFKKLYGYNEAGIRVMKVGNETLRIDNQSFTYDTVVEKQKETNRRFSYNTLARKQKSRLNLQQKTPNSS